MLMMMAIIMKKSKSSLVTIGIETGIKIDQLIVIVMALVMLNTIRIMSPIQRERTKYKDVKKKTKDVHQSYTHDTYTYRDKDFDCDEYTKKKSKYKGGNCSYSYDHYDKQRDRDHNSDSDKDYKKLDMKKKRHYCDHCCDLDSYSDSERDEVHGYHSMSTTHHSKHRDRD